MVNLLGALAAYYFFPKKQCISCERVYDNQLALSKNHRNRIYLYKMIGTSLLCY